MLVIFSVFLLISIGSPFSPPFTLSLSLYFYFIFSFISYSKSTHSVIRCWILPRRFVRNSFGDVFLHFSLSVCRFLSASFVRIYLEKQMERMNLHAKVLKICSMSGYSEFDNESFKGKQGKLFYNRFPLSVVTGCRVDLIFRVLFYLYTNEFFPPARRPHKTNKKGNDKSIRTVTELFSMWYYNDFSSLCGRFMC